MRNTFLLKQNIYCSPSFWHFFLVFIKKIYIFATITDPCTNQSARVTKTVFVQ
jgi:hypothetical protein